MIAGNSVTSGPAIKPLGTAEAEVTPLRRASTHQCERATMLKPDWHWGPRRPISSRGVRSVSVIVAMHQGMIIATLQGME
jgi:hypothetical protein